MKFELGKTVMTRGLYERYTSDDAFAEFVSHSFRKYANCDWGDCVEEDKRSNDNAVKNGERILGVYKNADGETIWIITEWDRSVTTILFPEEY